MNRRIVMVLLLCGAAVYAAASDDAPRKQRKHRSDRQAEKKASVDVPKVSFGNITLQTIYNNAHHRVLFVSPEGKRTFIFPRESCKVAALFVMTERKAPVEVTTADIETEHYFMDKGDHTYLLRHTPDGLTVHRITDSKKVTKGRVLFQIDTKDANRDLLIEHVAGKSKTSAFSVHEVGSLKQKDGHPKRASSGSLLGKK